MSFFIGSISYLMQILEITNNNQLHYNFYQWSNVPILVAIFIAVNESFLPKVKFSKLFNIFIFSLISTIFISVMPFDLTSPLTIIRIIVSFEVIIASLFLFIKKRLFTNLLFGLSILSFTVGGFSQSYDIEILSIYAYAQAFLFLCFVFIQKSEFIKKDAKGIDSYFSIEKELKKTKRALQSSQEQYKAIVENSNDVILLTKQKGINIYVSPAVENLFGYTQEEFTNFENFKVHPNDEEKVNEKIQEGWKGIPEANFEYRIITKNNDIKWVSHSWSPIKVRNEIKMIASSIRDITELKNINQKLEENIDYLKKSEMATLNIMEDFQETISALKIAEEQIKDLNVNLEKKVEERTEEVKNLLKQKNDFINQLGHDLKTPLTPLITLLPIIEKKQNDPKTKELLNVVNNNVSNIRNLVTKTLSLAKLNALSSGLEKENLVISGIVSDAINSNKLMAKKNNIKIKNNVNSDFKVEGDKNQLTELFSNLISNAIKYNDKEKGEVNINAIKKEDYLKISVKDNGVGLEKEQIRRIFNEFYKVDASRHDFDSSGLGLSICKRIIERHGGKIWVESEGLGKGSIFYINLKLKK